MRKTMNTSLGWERGVNIYREMDSSEQREQCCLKEFCDYSHILCVYHPRRKLQATHGH
jgi:hypothetical protein